jgi:hypothetical protein
MSSRAAPKDVFLDEGEILRRSAPQDDKRYLSSK